MTALPLLFLPHILPAQVTAKYLKQEFLHDGDTLRYRVLLPVNFDAEKKYPLVIFLHGSGERGRDNSWQLRHGSPLFADSSNRNRFPSIVIFPQCAPGDYWAQMTMLKERTDSTPQHVEYLKNVPPGKSLALVMLMLDSLVQEKFVDRKRIYVGGVSMGGRGTFEILWRRPDLFAAAFPIAGGGNPETVKSYGRQFPIWVFHGDEDDVVDVNDSRSMVTALKEAKTKVKYTEYPGVKHNAWDFAFQEPDLLPWVYSQRRK